jgi:hypothetical protein
MAAERHVSADDLANLLVGAETARLRPRWEWDIAADARIAAAVDAAKVAAARRSTGGPSSASEPEPSSSSGDESSAAMVALAEKTAARNARVMKMRLASGDRGERLVAADLAAAGVGPGCYQTDDELKAEQTAAHGRLRRGPSVIIPPHSRSLWRIPMLKNSSDE